MHYLTAFFDGVMQATKFILIATAWIVAIVFFILTALYAIYLAHSGAPASDVAAIVGIMLAGAIFFYGIFYAVTNGWEYED